MGQQKTIAYIAPDSTSGMAFYVQKADGACVGPNCSTYLTDWTSGSGGGNDTAQKISPSLNTQMKAGQQWKITLQNAGEGYYGYLDSPSGKNLPGPSGNTPGGAQFRLMTATEIKAQPPWLLATEATIGTAIVLVGIGILTMGEGDVDAIAIKKLSKLSYESVTLVEWGSYDYVYDESEFMAIEENVAGVVGNDAFNQLLIDAPQIDSSRIVEIGGDGGVIKMQKITESAQIQYNSWVL